MNRAFFSLLLLAVAGTTLVVVVALQRGGDVEISSAEAGSAQQGIPASPEAGDDGHPGPAPEPVLNGVDGTSGSNGESRYSTARRTVRRPGTLVRYHPEPGSPPDLLSRPAKSPSTHAGAGDAASASPDSGAPLEQTGGRSYSEATGAQRGPTSRHPHMTVRHIPEERLPARSSADTPGDAERRSQGSARSEGGAPPAIPVGFSPGVAPSGAGSPAGPSSSPDPGSPESPSPGGQSPTGGPPGGSSESDVNPAPSSPPSSGDGDGDAPPAPGSPPSDGLSIRLIPHTRLPRPGETVRLDVIIEGARDVVDVPFAITYDTSHLEYSGSTEGDFLNVQGDPIVFAVSNDPATGRISFGLSRYQRDLGVDGDGLLATIEMRVRTEGTTSVDFGRGAVRDGRGLFLAANFTGVTLGD